MRLQNVDLYMGILTDSIGIYIYTCEWAVRNITLCMYAKIQTCVDMLTSPDMFNGLFL